MMKFLKQRVRDFGLSGSRSIDSKARILDAKGRDSLDSFPDQKSFLSNYAIGNQQSVSTDPETLQKLKDQHMAVNQIEQNQKLINQSIN